MRTLNMLELPALTAGQQSRNGGTARGIPQGRGEALWRHGRECAALACLTLSPLTPGPWSGWSS
jgi:hypothetical protein